MERKSSVQQACHNNVEDVLSDPFLSLQTSNVNVIKHLQVWCGLEGHDVTRCWPLYCLQVAQHCVELLAHKDPPVILILLSILCAVHTTYAVLQCS